MKKPMSRLSFFTAVGSLAAAGCALPTAHVMGVQLMDTDFTEQRLAVALCVTNPNADALVFRRVTVSFSLAGSPPAIGSSDATIRLAPLSSTRVPLFVLAKVRNSGGQLVEFARARGVEYRVYGSVALDGASALNVPYSRSGHLDLGSALDVASPTAEITPSRCTGSELAIPL